MAWNLIRFRRLAFHPSAQFMGNGKFDFGEKCVIAKNVVLVVHGSMKIGSNVIVLEGSEFNADEIQIGDDTSVQRYSKIFGRVKIGSYNVLGPNLYISSKSHPFRLNPALNIRDQEELQSREGNVDKKVSIGEDCWFGINVVVMPGITIAKGCVVGANSVVTKDVPPYSVVAGVPAKVISKRTDFNPPKEIVPSDKNVPYFYDGFKTRIFERRDGYVCLSGPCFSVCLNTSNSKTLMIQAEGIEKIYSGQKSYGMVNGIIQIPKDALSVEGPAILFSCSEREWRRAKIKKVWVE